MEIEISTVRVPDTDGLAALFRQAGWHEKADPARLDAMVRGSTLVATAWADGHMVGFARCLTDRAFNAQINNVVVEEQHRGQGIGRRLVEALLADSDGVTYILRADPENVGFYQKLGFVPAKNALLYPRKR
jgi:GNAT superfamily N-acetyltransferase